MEYLIAGLLIFWAGRLVERWWWYHVVAPKMRAMKEELDANALG